MVQLRCLWINTLSLVTIAILGLPSVQSLPASEFASVERLSSTPQNAFYVPMEITNRVFNDSLLDPSSDYFQTLYEEVTMLLKNIYGCSDQTTCPTNTFYGGVVAMTFSSGSVIANATVVFDTSFINKYIVFALFTRNANIGTNTLQLNMDYTTSDNVKPATLVATTTTTTTTAPTTTTTPTTTSSTAPTTTTTPTTTSSTAATTTPTTTTRPTTTSTITSTTTPISSMPTPAATTNIVNENTASAITPSTTTLAANTASITTSLSYTTTETQDSRTTSSSQATTFSTDNTVASTTAANHGNSNNTYTTDGSHNSATYNTTTLDPPSNQSSVSSGQPIDPPTSGGGSSDRVPGWGIALLVLAAAILLLLIIIFIMMLVRWCCKKTESGHMDTTEDPYYPEKKQLPQTPLPVYTPQTSVTQKPESAPVIVGDTPKKNRTGFYAVNP